MIAERRKLQNKLNTLAKSLDSLTRALRLKEKAPLNKLLEKQAKAEKERFEKRQEAMVQAAQKKWEARREQQRRLATFENQLLSFQSRFVEERRDMLAKQAEEKAKVRRLEVVKLRSLDLENLDRQMDE